MTVQHTVNPVDFSIALVSSCSSAGRPERSSVTFAQRPCEASIVQVDDLQALPLGDEAWWQGAVERIVAQPQLLQLWKARGSALCKPLCITASGSMVRLGSVDGEGE